MNYFDFLILKGKINHKLFFFMNYELLGFFYGR